MATTPVPDEEAPYTPAGDVDAFLAALEDVDVEAASESAADDRERDAVLPALDAALDELATAVDAPTDEPETESAASTESTESADSGGLTRERADFDAVAESTEVDSIPYENAAAFLANTLYAVPPANTRFEWVETEDPTPDWDLDVDW